MQLFIARAGYFRDKFTDIDLAKRSQKMEQVTRRKFMTLAGTASIFAALPKTGKSAASKRALGIQLYTVAADLNANVPGTLQALNKIGYRFVESAGFAKLSAKEFRKALDDAGLQCPSCHLGFSTADPGPLFEDAHAIGAKYVTSSVLLPPRAGSGTGAERFKIFASLNADDFKAIAELANQIGAKARQAKLQYVYHNHNFEFVDYGNGQTGYQVLLKETDAKLVKFELDCGWATAAGHLPLDYFKRISNRFCMLHAKDFVLKGKPTYALFGPDRPTGTELGKGQIDYRPIFTAAEAAGVEYYFSEQEPPIVNMTAMEAAKANFDYMNSI
jgi:sugar phosphate isomerase/epimerase